jgi:hypothetical protein
LFYTLWDDGGGFQSYAAGLDYLRGFQFVCNEIRRLVSSAWPRPSMPLWVRIGTAISSVVVARVLSGYRGSGGAEYGRWSTAGTCGPAMTWAIRPNTFAWSCLESLHRRGFSAGQHAVAAGPAQHCCAGQALSSSHRGNQQAHVSAALSAADETTSRTSASERPDSSRYPVTSTISTSKART